tara:strand:- start:90 stop:683 length:594 start_codon:yes stop_codon:yes gene_type:complete
MKFVLASDSPRRKQLLSQFNLDLLIKPHQFNEASVEKEGCPLEYCMSISKGKAQSLISQYPASPILSADTVVTIDGKILEKPIDKDEAFNMLTILSGREHKVITGVSLFYRDKKINFSFSEETIVKFISLTNKEILYYIEQYEPYDKSGAYGIQDFSAIFVESIKGCFFNVMGLPLSTLFQYLKKFDLVQFPLNTGK